MVAVYLFILNIVSVTKLNYIYLLKLFSLQIFLCKVGRLNCCLYLQICVSLCAFEHKFIFKKNLRFPFEETGMGAMCGENGWGGFWYLIERVHKPIFPCVTSPLAADILFLHGCFCFSETLNLIVWSSVPAEFEQFKPQVLFWAKQKWSLALMAKIEFGFDFRNDLTQVNRFFNPIIPWFAIPSNPRR